MATPSKADRDFALAVLNQYDRPADLEKAFSDETGYFTFTARGRTAYFMPDEPSRFGDYLWQAYQALLDMADIAFYARPDDMWNLVEEGPEVAVFLNDRDGAVEVRSQDGEVLHHEDGPEDYYPGSVSNRDLLWVALERYLRGSKP